MKAPKIIVNGVSLDDVYTPQRARHSPGTRTLIGTARHSFCQDGDQLLLIMHALTAAQLLFDGVLPQDRSQPIELQIGRRKASRWRILSMETEENQQRERLVVFRLERA